MFHIPWQALLVSCLGIVEAGAGEYAKPKPMDAAESRRYKMERGLVMKRPLKIGRVRASAAKIARGDKFELTFGLEATFDNPFDPDDVRVDCDIAAPGGKKVVVPAFFCTPFKREAENSVGEPGKPVWKVRFTPRKPGRYRYTILARDRSGETKSRQGRMRCAGGEYEGFVRVSSRQPAAFEFDSGKPYYPVGLNLLFGKWAPPNRAIPPDRASRQCGLLNRLADAGCTFVRLRVDSYWNPIEATANRESKYLGPGWYHQQACWEIDRIYEAANKRGIHVMHCLYNANSLVGGHTLRRSSRQFAFVLKENGGPCETTEDFWTNEDMCRLVRHKLRYSVARWGYSPNLMCWEFFNEVHKPYEPKRLAWHRDMARYLRSVDPCDHPISTSSDYGTEDASRFWTIREMDFVQTHLYGKLDITGYLESVSRKITDECGKPVLFGEFGLHWRIRAWDDADPEGVGMHNSIWATAMGGGAGIADWYVTTIEKYDLFRHYLTFSDWAGDVPWNDPNMKPLAVEEAVSEEAGRTDVYKDMLIVCKARDLFAKMPKERFVVDPATRRVENAEYLQPYLHGGKSRKTRPTFVLDCKVPAQFQVCVSGTVGNASNRLDVYVDGKLARTQAFPAARGEGSSARYIARYDNWVVEYDRPRVVTVDVPAGRHEVMVEAVAKDRLQVTYRVNHYATGPDPVVVIGRRTENAAWFWVRNVVSTSANARLGIKPTPIGKVRAALRGLADGEYEIEWWDTWTGRVTGTSRSHSANGRMKIEASPFTRDVAGKAGLLR